MDLVKSPLDVYSPKYERYLDGDIYLISDTIDQLEDNFETAFGSEPTAEDMAKAFQFIQLFLSEIGETCSRTRMHKAASALYELMDDDVIETAKTLVFTCNNPKT
jgi:hypothetical protein